MHIPSDGISAPSPADWWPEARRVISPNFDLRPEGARPELIVIHAISLPPCEFGGPHIEQLFLNTLDRREHPYFESIADLRVSAHVLIVRDGSAVQFVPFTARAWHAGPSSWRGRPRCNDFSIGIELEGCDEQPFTELQYASLERLIRWLRSQFSLLEGDAIAGHSDIAPGRKTDPGPGFDWNRLASRLRPEPRG
ncbi:MAG TPA: 1,6-anhydro-N-acetylmuramyl-L-alanine amidase AmpD [Thioalkalivibrio sp.]|nr:1,6-anhydro-N-acetylmuramyl-L-alanine amidase AmpD [Thioalkalivibrio sp.]